MNREATIDLVVERIEESASLGADPVAFPDRPVTAQRLGPKPAVLFKGRHEHQGRRLLP